MRNVDNLYATAIQMWNHDKSEPKKSVWRGVRTSTKPKQTIVSFFSVTGMESLSSVWEVHAKDAKKLKP